MATTAEPAGYEVLTFRDWIIPQGSDTTNTFRFGVQETESSPVQWIDLTAEGYEASAQIRKGVGKEVWVTFNSADTSGPRIELTSDGYVHIVLPHAETENPAWDKRTSGAYDVELLTPEGVKWRLGAGTVKVVPDVTRVANG